MNLDGLRVAVTGAGRDSGRLLATAFADHGAHVFVSARNEAAAEHTAESIRQRGRGTGEAFACDLASPDSVRAFAAALADRTDHLDVLVNNGAGYLHGETSTMSRTTTSSPRSAARRPARVVDCVLFAVSQPRDCFIREFRFEQVVGPRPGTPTAGLR